MKYPSVELEERTLSNRLKRKALAKLNRGPAAKITRRLIKSAERPAGRAYPPVNAALVGAGNVARWAYVPAIRWGSGFHLKGVFEPNESAAKAVAGEFSAKVYTSLDELVSDESIGAVLVCSPPHFHREAAVAALKAGKHVLCEKPLSDRYEDACVMWDAARDSGLRHMVNFSYRYRADIAHFIEIVQSGQLGTIYHITGTLSQGQWFSEAGEPSGERGDDAPWRYRPGGGVVSELGSHLVDLLRMCLGEVRSVRAWTESFRGDVPDCENAGGLSLKFRRGPVAHVMTSRLATGFKEHVSIEVSGSRGCLKYEEGALRLWTRADPRWRDLLCPSPRDRNFLSAFHAAIHDRSRVIPGFWDGFKNSEVLEAIFRSAETGDLVELPEEAPLAPREQTPTPDVARS